MADDVTREGLRRLYGTGDLAERPVFTGGFINFGYWAGIPLGGTLTVDQRTASQRALYDLVLDHLALTPDHRVLEVGCGRGRGAREVLLRNPRSLHGLDLVPQQVARARENTPGATFTAGSASDIPLPDNAFDRLLSVEAAQHFEDLTGFAREAARVLVPGGRLAVTTFFACHEGLGPQLAALLETFATGLDLAHPVGRFAADLRAAGFVDVRADSIGEHVWTGLDRWLALGDQPDRWDRNYARAAGRGLLDYYLVTANLGTARQPAGSGV
ncbi:methyltransferase domain-containing protein [Actinosynnema sp. NPDC050436]|uniref:class I SAM-dependent methyltransferase n=1 Tax=Actinosynnema sp. NPDC050436 TaxID=3155659 RepID=UPI0033F53400